MAEIKLSYEVVLDSILVAARATAECSNACRVQAPDASRVCLDTSELCWATASLLSRGSHFMALQLKALIGALDVCTNQCKPHAEGHCKRCAEATSRALTDARRLLGELPVEGIATGQRGLEKSH